MSSIKKIGIIIPYFGTWPPWMKYFLLSCKHNPTIDWHLFTDCGEVEGSGDNVYFHTMSLDDFNTLASGKLKLNVNIINPYKLCDFKPAYGKIFEDYLVYYDFWGYGDLDLIYGNIRRYYNDERLEKFDILSSHKDFVTGHFCILRNTEKIKHLFKLGGFYKEAFTKNNYIGFDEQQLTIKVFTQPFIFRVSYKLNFLYHILTYKVLKNPLIRYVGKFVKRFLIRRENEELLDFTAIVMKAYKEHIIIAYFETIHLSDLSYIKNNQKDWCIIWDKGNLTDNNSSKEMLYFHFMSSKDKLRFIVDGNKGPIKKFTIQRKGIRIKV